MHAFVAILTNNPELQKRLQDEADGASGDEAARLAHKEKMPLMEAVGSQHTDFLFWINWYL